MSAIQGQIQLPCHTFLLSKTVLAQAVVFFVCLFLPKSQEIVIKIMLSKDHAYLVSQSWSQAVTAAGARLCHHLVGYLRSAAVWLSSVSQCTLSSQPGFCSGCIQHTLKERGDLNTSLKKGSWELFYHTLQVFLFCLLLISLIISG